MVLRRCRYRVERALHADRNVLQGTWPEFLTAAHCVNFAAHGGDPGLDVVFSRFLARLSRLATGMLLDSTRVDSL